jgi:hypothetical protein
MNPQKATAYVGPGVLRKGGKITPVPNGPLVKKKGLYAGSTLKNGGTTTKQTTIRPGTTKDSTAYFDRAEKSFMRLANSESKKGNEAVSNKMVKLAKNSFENKKRQSLKGKKEYDKNGYSIKKNGGMIKRADGSYSKRGLWDNIRANKGSGKKPTKQMLQQEKKIKAKSKK